MSNYWLEPPAGCNQLAPIVHSENVVFKIKLIWKKNQTNGTFFSIILPYLINFLSTINITFINSTQPSLQMCTQHDKLLDHSDANPIWRNICATWCTLTHTHTHTCGKASLKLHHCLLLPRHPIPEKCFRAKLITRLPFEFVFVSEWGERFFPQFSTHLTIFPLIVLRIWLYFYVFRPPVVLALFSCLGEEGFESFNRWIGNLACFDSNEKLTQSLSASGRFRNNLTSIFDEKEIKKLCSPESDLYFLALWNCLQTSCKSKELSKSRINFCSLSTRLLRKFNQTFLYFFCSSCTNIQVHKCRIPTSITFHLHFSQPHSGALKKVDMIK